MSERKLTLTSGQFEELLWILTGVEFEAFRRKCKFEPEEPIKVEPYIMRDFVKAKAIRVYPTELMKNINSTIESGEKPVLLVKLTYSPKRGVNEFEIVFMGSRHIEDLGYYKKPPKKWRSWGEIVLSPDQARQLAEFFLKASSQA